MSAAPFPSPTAKWHTATYPSISPSRPALSGKGKTILITGGGTGIGAQTAHSFAAAGASRIALLGRREQPILTTKVSLNEDFPDVEIFVASTDITKKSEVDAAFAGFLGADGKIDVLVSNAATIGPQDPAGKVDIDKFTDAVAINLEGSLNLAQVFLKYAAEDAVVVEVNSSAAHLNFAAQFSCYSIAKLAVYRLWDSIAYAHPELRVYHIQPGVVDTDMNKEAGGVAAVGFEDHGKSERAITYPCFSFYILNL